MGVRLLGLGARTALLLVFAIFFIAPVLWLVLAPTKTDNALITSRSTAMAAAALKSAYRKASW